MPHFTVTLVHDLSSNHNVTADTPEDAVERACEDAPSRICNHCSNNYDMGDVVRAIVSDESDNEVLVDDMGGFPNGWQPIEKADKSEILLVNDSTGFSSAPWVAAKYINHPEWSGWAYEDDILTDGNPLGPQPTHFFHVPPLPAPLQ